MNPLLELTLTELTTALRERRASAAELMEAVLARIEATHDDLNAVVSMFPEADLHAAAREADERIARGEARPLEGVPLGVKDLEDLEGLVTSYGSLPFKDNMATRDAIHVGRLRAAGAIPIGKTNTPEFGFTAITKNLVYGTTRNPWNLERTPGGSSGGSSAALAAGVLPLVTSSDGGGSVRLPASFVGAFGLKPSFGRVPIGPGDRWGFGDTSCYGPTTKTVEDGALYMDQVVGPSAHDPNSLPHPGLSYVDAVRAGLPAGTRVAYSPDLGYANVQNDIAETVYDAARVFEKLGHPFEQIAGGPPAMGADWGRWGGFEQAGKLHPLMAEREGDFGRAFLRGVKSGWDMTPEIFGEMSRQRMVLNEWCADVFDRFDLLITPTTPFDPPPAGGPFPRETEGKPQLAWGVASFTIPFNLSWHPAATVRAGLSNAGLPIGLQIVGPRHRDDLVLQAAAAFERERPWHPNWPVSF